MAITSADSILSTVYHQLNINNSTSQQKFQQIDSIVVALQAIHNANPINGKTTGTISERLCELALEFSVPNIYKRLSDRWNWMADFSILGHPFNLLISVKSFKAKERLLVSGSGNILSPTVGWGLFDDASEWTEQRTKTYLFRSFIAIYMPSNLYNIISLASKNIHNINGKLFLRSMDEFPRDLLNAINNNVIDITLF
jgi:hypothetical protein